MTDWIKCNGGECPIKSDKTRVDLKFRNGQTIERYFAKEWAWNHKESYCDIIAYRIVEDHEPMAYTPLNEKLGHPLLDVFNAGCTARDAGRGTSGYPGNSLEHVIHAAGWVQRDLRLALDKHQGKEPKMTQTREQITAQIEALQKQLDAMPVVVRKYWDGFHCAGRVCGAHYFDIETINGVPHIHGVAMKEVGK